MLVATTAAPQAQLQAPKHGVDIVGVQLDANAESDAADCTELLSDRFVPATPSLSTIPQSAAATEARRTVATLIPALVALFLLVACTTNLLVTGLGPGSRFFVNGMSALNHDRRIAYKSAWQQLLPAADTKARLSSSHGLSQPANAAACASLAVLLIGALVHTKLQSWSHSGLSRYSSLPSRGIPATAPDVITPQSCFQRACAALRGGAGAGGGPVWDDIALPMLCGGVIGLAMAAYQTLLGGTIATVWGLAQTVLSPAWSVLLVPASLLSLSALLATQLPQANGVNFVSAVSKHETLSFSRGVVRYARAPSRMLYARHIYMPHLYAPSICLIYMPHLYAIACSMRATRRDGAMVATRAASSNLCYAQPSHPPAPLAGGNHSRLNPRHHEWRLSWSRGSMPLCGCGAGARHSQRPAVRRPARTRGRAASALDGAHRRMRRHLGLF